VFRERLGAQAVKLFLLGAMAHAMIRIFAALLLLVFVGRPQLAKADIRPKEAGSHYDLKPSLRLRRNTRGSPALPSVKTAYSRRGIVPFNKQPLHRYFFSSLANEFFLDSAAPSLI